jgi:hypothetical protein
MKVAVVTMPKQPVPLATIAPPPTAAQTRQTTGKVILHTIPTGVSVAIDGRNMGMVGAGAEGKQLELKAGTHLLTVPSTEIAGVRYSGYEQKFVVESGKTTSLGTLRLLPFRQLTLAISGPGVVVRINGDPYAMNGRPLTVNLPEGRVEIRAKAVNGKVYERTINLKGDNLTLTQSLE